MLKVVFYFTFSFFICPVSYDCGFFILKYLESWDEKTMALFSQDDVPNMRIKYMLSMLHYSANLLTWHQVLKG